MNLCKCGHGKERHFDLIDEDSGGNLRADRGCWECEHNDALHDRNCYGYEEEKELEK